MAKIACTVLTKDHPESIEDVLIHSAKVYRDYDIDLYYYDSSEDDKTEKVIERFRQMGLDNIYYMHLDIETPYDYKLELILQGYGLQKEYEYIWPVKDRSYFELATVREIVKAAGQKHDVITIGICQDEEKVTTVYTDAKEFYYEWAWIATSLDACMYRISTIIPYMQVREEEKPLLGWRISFFLWYRLFANLIRLDSYTVKVLCGANILINNSEYSNSEWIERIFTVWKDRWLEANDALPSYYDEYKDIVIKETVKKPWLIGGRHRLIELHNMDILREDNCEEILQNWKRISDVDSDIVRRIARGVYDIEHDISTVETKDEVAELLIQMMQMVQQGQMVQQQIPMEAIIDVVKNKLSNSAKFPSNNLDIICGTITDMEKRMKTRELSMQELLNDLQIVLSYILICTQE